MIKEIRYNGFTETPSDYECPDGDLAAMEGLVNEDGGLHPILMPTAMFTLPYGYDVVFIHKNTGYTHYIIRNGNYVYWINEPQHGATISASTITNNWLYTFSSTIYEFNAVGNTLIILASDGIHYFLWKGSAYANLGIRLPELPVSFGLQGELKTSDTFFFEFDTIPIADLTNTFSDNNKQRIGDAVLAQVNKFIADKATNDGRFIYSFLVRYAYRLYDQTLTMHSSPVLMVATSDLAPQCFVVEWHENENGAYGAECKVVAMVHQLDYKALISSAQKDIIQNDWGDIIKSVDVFISQPIYTYDQAGKVKCFMDDPVNGYSVCSPIYYQDRNFVDLFSSLYLGTALPSGRPNWIDLPTKDDSSIMDAVATSRFYLVKSISIAELNISTRSVIEVGKDVLSTLVNRELMTDDYDSHDLLKATRSFSYNNRLNIAGISKVLYDGYHAGGQFAHTNGSVTSNYKIRICIKQDGKDIVVDGTESTFYPLQAASGSGNYKLHQFQYIFYPNIHAYEAYLINTTHGGRFRFDLKPHEGLNGAYCFLGFDNTVHNISADVPPATIPSVTIDKTVNLPNKIYTSEVDNPFYFPANGINSVGTGTILGICAAVKALSQGQFGQFPLYAFTDEGVWALEQTDTGLYKARQPVSRDVCTIAESITQIDTAVLFATKRGIMLISGSNTTCISDAITSDNPFDIDDLDAVGGLGYVHIRFLDYIANCRMLYDYTHQRVIVYNPTKLYAYVYSLKTKTWSTMPSNIKGSLNSYPDALAQVEVTTQQGQQSVTANTIYNYCEDDTNVTTGFNGIIVTRPLKLDAPDVLKTVDSIIQRGYFRKGHVSVLLYGSRDLMTWIPVYSSDDHYLRGFRGTPYKYFRLALICALDKEESIFGCSVQYTPRQVNKLR